jgi:hypothetical protein
VPSPSAEPTTQPSPEPTEGVGPITTAEPSPEPTEGVAAATSEPGATPRPDTRPAPLIVAKVDNRGTRAYSDDRLLPGATFRIYQDDGDGKYERDTDILAFDGVAEHGFLVFKQPTPGRYWVIEVDAPSGYELSRPRLIAYPGGTRAAECVAAPGGRLRCEAAAAGHPGFVMLVVPDRPAGLPPTDAVGRRRR